MVDAIALAIGIVGALLTVASILVPIFALHYSRKWRKQDDMAAEQRQIVYRQDKDESRRKDKDARLERLLERFDHGGVHTARSQLNAYKAAHPDGALWTALHLKSQACKLQSIGGQDLHSRLARQRLEKLLQEDYVRVHDAMYRQKGFWEELFQAARNNELPGEFARCKQGRLWLNRRWLIRANSFRELVEPFDIAAFSFKGYVANPIGGYLANKDDTNIFRIIETLWRQDCRTVGRKDFRSSTIWAEAIRDGKDPSKMPPLQICNVD